MGKLLIRAARVIDGTGAPARTAHDVLVEGERIAAVGPRGSLAADGAETLDLPGGTLLPGFVNMHAHLRGWTRGAPDLSEEMGLLAASQNARLAILGGVTTLRDAGAPGRLSQIIRDAIASGLLTGPRIISAGRIITTSAGHGWKHGLRADDAAELRKAVRMNVEDGADTIKIAATGGGGTPGSNVGSAQYSAEELTVAVEEAHRLGRRVLVHCNGTLGTKNAVVAGVDTIEHIGWMGQDGKLEVAGSAIDGMIAKNITVVPTMAVWFRPGYDDIASLSADQKKMRAVREERTAAWTRMFKAGVRFATGTDTWDPIARELELMVDELGLTPMQAIVSATRDSAIGLGLGDEIGTIEVGKRADLVQLAGDPVADIGALRRVERVWSAGRLAVDGGHVAG